MGFCITGIKSARFVILLMLTASLVAQDDNSKSGEHSQDITADFYNSYSRMSTFQSALVNDEILGELEIVGGQKAKIKKINKQYANDVAAIVHEINQEWQATNQNVELNSDQKKAELKTLDHQKLTRWNEAAMKSIEQIEAELLPHQFQRLNQLSLQVEMARKHLNHYASIKHVFDRIGLDKKQQTETAKKLDAIQQKYDQELAELRKKYQRKMLERFPDSAKEKLKGVLGNLDVFEK